MNTLAEEHLGVAVVDDDPIYRELICATVAKRSKFVLFEASSGNDLFTILATQQIDCIVLDYDLGEESGLAIMERIDETYAEPPPIIMMTGGGRESTAVRAFRMGVSDYLPKSSLRPEHFVTSVIKVVERDRQESLIRIEHKRLVAASGVDFVTGLEGRARLDERLNQLALLPAPSRAFYALILVEFVEYSHVKQRFGLKVADQSLRAFGKRLQELGRSSDVCGRYSGETFLVITDVGPEAGTLDAICQRLSKNLTQRLNLNSAQISISGCVAGSKCLETALPDKAAAVCLLEPATALLAQAKGARLPFKTAPDVGVESSLLRASNVFHPANSEAPLTTKGRDAHPAADELRSTDRRREIRQRVFKRGLIHMIDSDETSNCLVRNISSHGAGLRVDDSFAVPEIFDLEVTGSGAKQRVRLRWQAGVNVGVEFVDVTSTHLPLAGHAHSLCLRDRE
jgi:diguanylate cyclase (GGDEF)-like protein